MIVALGHTKSMNSPDDGIWRGLGRQVRLENGTLNDISQ